MDVNKAIRKQIKSYKIFMLTMCFIFFILPVVLFFTAKTNIFFICYLGIIELLILSAIAVRINTETLSYECSGNKFKIKNGIWGGNFNIICDKVVLVHVEEKEGESEIILLTNSKFRNKIIKVVDESFMKKYSYAAHEYSRIKKMYPEEEYYYIILDKGGIIKYKLLIDLYYNCVKAYYTDDTIECIKRWKS